MLIARPKSTSGVCIVILGMHRSGTSALAGVLSMLGVSAGDTLMPGMEGVNPKGFWEHAEIVAIHDLLLQALDSSWDDIAPLPEGWWNLPKVQPFRESIKKRITSDFGSLDLWLIKDPRLNRLLPLWLDILKELKHTPKFVLALRHPMEVAQSLKKRDGMHLDHAALLWLDAMCHCELYSRTYQRCFVRYEDLLADWRKEASRIASQLEVALNPGDKTMQTVIDDFLDSSLRHHRENPAQTTANSSAWQSALGYYQTLLRPASEGAFEQETDNLLPLIEGLRNEIMTDGDGSYRLWSLEHDLQRKKLQLESLQLQVCLLQSQMAHMQSTWSWRLTRPLRCPLLQKLASALGLRKKQQPRKETGSPC